MTLLASKTNGLYSARPSGRKGQLYYATDVPFGEYYHDGTLWRPVIQGVVGAEPPTSGWTSQNLRGGTDALTVSGSLRSLSTPSNSGSHGWRYETRSLTVQSRTITACIATVGSSAHGGTQDGYFGIGAYESSTGKLVSVNQRVSAAKPYVDTVRWVDDSNFSSVGSQHMAFGSPPIFWQKIVADSTDWYFYVSYDGVSYMQVSSAMSITGWMSGSGPDNLFWGSNPFNGDASCSLLSLEWT